jgi:hypothetical protein
MGLRGRNNVFTQANRANAQAFADAREEVVNLNATPFASTVDSPSIDIETPVTVVGSRTEPTQESLIPKDTRYDEDYKKLAGSSYVDSRIPPMIWDSAKKMNVPNPAYVAPDYSGLELLNSLGTDFKIDFSNFAEVSKNLQKEETEKYGLIAPPEGFDAYADIASSAQKIYLDEANKMIKDFGVDKKDAEQWYSDILEFTKDRPVYGLDVNPELKQLATHKDRLKNEGYVNKTNEWINELEGLREQDTASFTSSFNEMPTKNKLQYLYSAYEKGELTKDEYKENFKNTVNANYDPQLNPNTSIIIDIKGNDYLVGASNVYGQMTDPFFLSRGASYADDSLYFPSENVTEGEWLQSIGEGQRSAEDKIYKTLEGGTASFFLNNPVTQIAGLVIPGFSAATTLAKVATGEKVSPMEIANTFLTGLDMAGAVQAPVNAGKFDSTKLAGPVAPTGSTAGTGLFGTTYNQTKTALNVAAAGDAKGAAIALVGDKIIKGGLEKAGLDEEAIKNAGIQYDDFEAGVGKTVQKLAEGEELDDALAHGLGKYIREGGTLGSIDLPSINLPSIDLGDSELLGSIADALSATETAVRQGLSKFDKEVLQPVTKPIGDTLSAAETEVRQGLSTLDKEVLQPITQPIGDIAEDVAQVTGDIVEDVAQGAGDVLSDLDTAIRQALPDIDLPDIDLPSIDLPSIDLPFDLRPSLMSDTGGDVIPFLSPTRTTDSLFNDELFKFETEIGISDYPLVDEELELFYPESAPQLDYAPDYDNFFENTIYEAKPRSYDF